MTTQVNKKEEVRQPLMLNHDGDDMLEVFGIIKEELAKAVMEGSETGVSDNLFALVLFNIFNDDVLCEGIWTMVSIFEKIYGEKFDKKSEIVEHLTNAIVDNDDRVDIIAAAAGALSAAEERRRNENEQ